MNPREYQQMAELEQSHWWFQGTRRVIFSLLDAALSSSGRSSRRILDLGSGTGHTTALLARRGQVFAVDQAPVALRWARSKGTPAQLLAAQADRLPFADGTFGVVTALDILEHAADDRTVLAEIRRVLEPGGLLLLTVPAWELLWSEHDEALGHHRRYRRQTLSERALAAGLSIERLTCYNSLLFPAAFSYRMMRKALQRLIPEQKHEVRSDLQPAPWLLNEVLERLLASERHVLRHLDLPVGLSLLMLARRLEPYSSAPGVP